MQLLPLFPLEVVVFPRTQLPLHIFEERYKEMVGQALRDKSEFGIVLAKGEGIVNAGCTVVVESVLKTYDDGKLDIVTVGRRRFEILMLDQEKNYLRGEVQFFDDDDSVPPPLELQNRAIAQYRGLLEIGESGGYGNPDLEDPQLSFQIAQGVQDLDFLNMLLRTRSETQRLKDLTQFLSEYLPRQRYVARVKTLAPQNGHGGKPAGL